MAIGREARTQERKQRALETFGPDATTALEVFELLELAWHDCYSEITPPDAVMEDIWLMSNGRLTGLIAAARLACTDWRDLRVHADQLRQSL